MTAGSKRPQKTGSVGPLFEAWRALFGGRKPKWAVLNPDIRKLLEAGRLAEVGALSLSLSAHDDVPRRLTWASVWYTVVICAKRPIQTGLPIECVYDLVGSLGATVDEVDYDATLAERVTWIEGLGRGRLPHKEQLLYAFPRKSHPQAGRKANLFLDKMLEDLAAYNPANLSVLARLWGKLAPGALTDDQACSSLLYADAVSHELGFENGLRLAIWAILNPVDAGYLSDIFKATGVNADPRGAVFCELRVLLGRGVNPCDLKADARRRLDGSLRLPLVCVDQGALRTVVNKILDEELEGEVDLPPVDVFWAERYRWCVGGSHNLATNAHWQHDNARLDRQLGELRWNRRAAAEVTEACPLDNWDGRVEVSVAEKLEHAKGRAIYSCDTLSYFAFSWLLRSVEERWRSKRVILDPGRDGHLGMFNRIRGMCANMRAPVFTMLDYSDFNSQHSLESQQTVIDCILQRVRHGNPTLAGRLVDSFNHMYIRMGGGIIGRVGGSLMSGHRGTTFLNSVLNAAYIRLALGDQRYNSVLSLHVGDDVLIISEDETVGWRSAEAVTALGCTLQPSKQSVGRHGFEFLRMAGHPTAGAQGYLARSIAGLVSGNWVTDFRSGPLAALHSLIQQVRSIINRSRNPHSWRLVASSAGTITGLDVAEVTDFLSGAVAAAPGPCYRNDGRYCYRVVTEEGGESERMNLAKRMVRYPRFASRDYVERGVSLLEREGLRLAGFIPWNAMALSSFGTMELSRPLGTSSSREKLRLRVSGLRVKLKSGVVGTSVLTTTAKQHGLLAHHPILSLLKNTLSVDQVRHLLDMAGEDYDRRRPLRAAWGGAEEGVVVHGFLPYSDGAGSESRNVASTLRVDTPIYL